jgi:hypothetical protein
MALLFECTPSCARKLLDTADIVRDAIYRQIAAARGQLRGIVTLLEIENQAAQGHLLGSSS